MKMIFIALIVSVFLLNQGCQKSLDKNPISKIYSPELMDSSKIISNRSTLDNQFVVIFKLKNPALLSALKEDKLKKVINPELANAIQGEQDRFINEIKTKFPTSVIMMKYKYVLNAVAVMTTQDDYLKIRQLGMTSQTQRTAEFEQPKMDPNAPQITEIFNKNNSALFIGVQSALDKNIKGQNMRVGIIDTGIDYTHSMLGGSGQADDYRLTNPSKSSDKFPNAKVVGGYDFVGSDYSPGSYIVENRIPKPDVNPIDEAGHGTHVAGTVAGVGDDEHTYDGIAPLAQLYALKVFGKNGSTTEEVVISALEYAVDPDGDGNIDDRLDVLNLSLGSSYGSPHNMYRMAIHNLSLAGTVVVAAAGNSGDTPYIVGSPSISDEALSVAASIDNSDHNWKFQAIEAESESKTFLFDFVEGAFGKKINSLDINKKEKIIYVGLAKDDFTPEQVEKIKGNIALIDRGENSFADKVARVENAGAIGAIVLNNVTGSLILMSGGRSAIPTAMISLENGQKIKELLSQSDVFLAMNSNKKIEKPELIDTIADFSSRGPRSEDSLIKPEISAPGQQIVSAWMGRGNLGVPLSGTSMAAPHMAGVMTLMKQFYPELTVNELKSVVIGTAKTILDDDKKVYSVSRMGAGRVQIQNALGASIVTNFPTLSLGEVKVDVKKVLYKEMTIRSLKPESISVQVRYEGHPGISMESSTIQLAPKGEATLGIKLLIDSSQIKNSLEEIDGFVKFYSGETEIDRIPVLAVVRKISNLSSQTLLVNSSSESDADGALVELTVQNKSTQSGLLIPMNLISLDERKYALQSDEIVESRACDVQAVGYKIIGNRIFFGIKMYQPLTNWQLCEVSVLFDQDGDEQADQELAGASADRLAGASQGGGLQSMLLDAKRVKEIRMEYDRGVTAGKSVSLNYFKAVQDLQPMMALDHTTVAILQADLSKIKTMKNGQVSFKIMSSSTEGYNVEDDDYLGTDETQWRKMDLTSVGQSFIFSELSQKVDPNAAAKLNFSKGFGREGLILLIPTNRSLLGGATNDDQLELVKPRFLNY